MPITQGKQVIEAFANSERVQEDLYEDEHAGATTHLVVCPYWDIPMWSEFRCFVKGRRVAAISQYMYYERYSALVACRDWLLNDVLLPFLGRVMPRLPMEDAVVDVAVGRDLEGPQDATQHTCFVVELNPLSPWTDPCLFDWEDPTLLTNASPAFRVVTEESAVPDLSKLFEKA